MAAKAITTICFTTASTMVISAAETQKKAGSVNSSHKEEQKLLMQLL
jgi:hypothetical protein